MLWLGGRREAIGTTQLQLSNGLYEDDLGGAGSIVCLRLQVRAPSSGLLVPLLSVNVLPLVPVDPASGKPPPLAPPVSPCSRTPPLEVEGTLGHSCRARR